METNEKPRKTEVFDIKRQNVEKLDEKTVENLQKDFVIKFGRHVVPQIMQKNGMSDCPGWVTSVMYKGDSFFETFKACSEKLKAGLNQDGSATYLTEKDEIDAKNIPLVTIKQAFLKDGSYYFYTSEGQILQVDKYDFDQNGLWAKSLDFYGNPLSYGNIEGNTAREIITNNVKITVGGDGFIHFYEGRGYGKHGLQLPGKKAFQIETNSILIQDGGKLTQYKVSHGGYYQKLKIFDIPFKGISQMVVDQNRNFLLIVNKTDEGSKLHIINLYDFIKNEKINEIYQIKGVEDIAGLGNDNGMICMMENGELQYFRNTFSKFSRKFFETGDFGTAPGELIYPKDQEVTTMSDSSRKALEEALDNDLITADFDEEIVDETEEIDQNLVDKIWNIKSPNTGITLKEMFDNANDEKSIESVLKTFQRLKKNPKIASVAGITRSIDEAIEAKKNKIALESIFTDLQAIEAELGEEPDLRALITIRDKLKAIQKRRGKINVGRTAEDETLNEIINSVNEAIKQYQESNKEECMEKIDENLLEIKKMLDGYDYLSSVTKIRATPIRKETEEMIGLLDASTKSEYEAKLSSLETNRIVELNDFSAKQKEEQTQQINKIKSDIKGKIDELKLIFSEIDEADEIEDLWDSNELVKRINEKIKELPNKDADEILLQLRRTLDDVKYQSMISSADSVGIVRTLDDFGIDTSLYYNEDGSEEVEWKISWQKLQDGTYNIAVTLINGETHEYTEEMYDNDGETYRNVPLLKNGDQIPLNFNFTKKEKDVFQNKLNKWRDGYDGRISGKEQLKALKEQLKNETDSEKRDSLNKEILKLKEYYKDIRYTESIISRLIKQQKLNPRSKVPSRNSDYIVLDEEKEILKTLSARLRCQKKYGGIDILEGGPGLGKTVMCEFLASVTNREIAVVACGRVDPETMIFSPSIKGKNSGWEPADWVTLMQKPGTLIVFDEIDKLPPAAVVKLHSLFDTRRSVYHDKMGEVKANPDCLFMGTRNLYDTLSNPIASRARIFRMTYPSVRNEAYKISKYAKDNPVLNMLKYEDFNELYDKYVVRGEPEPKNAREKKVYQEIINIDKLLQVFTKLRELFGEDKYNYEISYRDAQKVYQDYNNGIDFKTATMNALLRGAGAVTEGDKSEKNEQVETVKAVIDSVMQDIEN